LRPFDAQFCRLCAITAQFGDRVGPALESMISTVVVALRSRRRVPNGRDGGFLAAAPPAMTSPVPEQRTVRSKAVWGDKRTLAVIALLVLGLASNVFAERAHAQPGPRARPDRPNAIAEQHHGKLDDEL